MNEILIKQLIKCKLSMASKIVDQLPPEISKELKNLGLIVAESISENFKEIKEQPVDKTKSSDKINNIPIE